MKTLFFLFVMLAWSLFFPFTQAFAQDLNTNNVEASNEWRTNSNVEQNQRTYTQSTVIELLVSASCILTGVDPVNPNTPCLGVDPVSRKLGYVKPHQGGLTGVFAGMIGGMYNIPVSSRDYVAYSTSRFGITQRAYAQPADRGPGLSSSSGESEDNEVGETMNTDTGVGFGALSPVVKVWEAFRNIVFIFMVILFVLIGVGMMFRLQVDQRAVMSVQNQLPKIVLVIILVVLSYGIAGFLIDMMYVSMYFIFSIFSGIEGVRLDPSILQSSNPFGALGGVGGIGHITANASGSVGDIIAGIFDGTAGRIVGGLLTGIIGAIVGGAFFGPAGLVVGPIVGAIGGGVLGGTVVGLLGMVVAFAIFAVAIMIALARIWFSLIKAFVSILIGATIAPLWIAASLIPSTPFPLGSWFRFMIGNLLMFPATLVMFLFAYVFLQLFAKSSGGTISFPFVGNPNDVDAFGALIAFGIVMMTPTVITKVKDAIGTGGVETGLGATLGAGYGVASIPMRRAGGVLFARDEHGAAKGLAAKTYDKGKWAVGRKIENVPFIGKNIKKFSEWSGKGNEESQSSLRSQKEQQSNPDNDMSERGNNS